MPELKLDHIVHYVNDLGAGIQLFTDAGLDAFRGGSHTRWGTHNALCYFGLFYVELLGIERPEYAKNPEEPNLLVEDAVKFLPGRETFGRIAFRTQNIEELAASLASKGAAVTPIKDGKRLNAQGQLIEWRMMMIEGNINGLVFPFIIQWKVDDQERFRAMSEAGIIKPHPAGNVKFGSAVFEVSDPSETALRWSELFGFPAEIKSGGDSAVLTVDGKPLIFAKGTKNNLSRIVFKTEAPGLKGTTLHIGEGEYGFE
ncbi:VOC family protein [Neobacillus piezotolerans]|uniref:VOC family protein n=1 Tax=Neobacillus piezotolerans TaxID=2259171 RepID=A0A3D8GP96_9BACI|nr:VOC family protein [Neobacillus piezotolerans]RDU36305.1 VOC family protein [Neobacillus piezotolerans]